MNETGPEIGDYVTFTPAPFMQSGSFHGIAAFPTGLKVTGTVIQVNHAHRWVRVRYDSPVGPQYECFKF